MFEKPFDLLNRAVDRIEEQLANSTDEEHKAILGEELAALRNSCDAFVEKWLSFEERVSELSERYGLEIDGVVPTDQLQGIQEKWAMLQGQQQPLIAKQQPMGGDEGAVLNGSDGQAMEGLAEQADADAIADQGTSAKKPVAKLVYPIGDGVSIRPRDEQMVRSFRRGIGYFDLLMFPESMKEFERVLALDDRIAIARLYLAFGHLAQEEYELAAKQLNLLKEEEADEFLQATVHATYGHIFVAQGNYAQALVEFEAAVARVPDFRDVHFNIGCCQYNLGRKREALRSFQKQLIPAPDDWEAHRLCALLWERLGQREKAYLHLARAYDLNGANEQVILEFAHLSEQMGEIDQARGLYKKALRYHPRSAGALGGLGWLKMREGDVASAVGYFQKQLSLQPEDRQAIFNLGWASFRMGDYERAAKCFTHLLTRSSRDSYALAALARTWAMQGRKAEAKEQLLQLVASEGAAEKKLGLYHLGRLAMEEEQYLQALRYFNAALVYDRDCIESLFYKGVAHWALGERERAEQCFAKCRRQTGTGSA
jgi:tetratricopeptide (TPR) repeat protein